LRSVLKQTLENVLGRFDLRLIRKQKADHPHLRERYLFLTHQVEKLLLSSTLRGLPQDSRRAELLAALEGMQVLHGLCLLDCLHKSLPLPGAVCEFGCANGATSALMANEIRHTDKELWLFDSFQGLSRPTEKDVLTDDFLGLGSMEKYDGAMCCPVTEVTARLRAVSFPPSRTRIVPGYIEKTIERQDLPAPVCFALVDFDLYSPVLTALSFLHGRLVEGAYVLVHDYGYFCTGAKAALDEFLAEHPDDYRFSLPDLLDGHHALIQKKAV